VQSRRSHGFGGSLPRLVAALIFAGGAFVLAQAPPDATLLARFRPKIQQTLSQVPNYTCLETIQRSVRNPRAKTFSLLDSILLEVSTVKGEEMLAWPGARRFEEADPSSFVTAGLLSTGVFASHARSVFLHDSALIQYSGAEELAGRPAVRFDFRIPEGSSGYRIRTNGSSAEVATAGSFWVEPASLELLRLDVRADAIPAALGIQRTETMIEYAPMRIGSAAVQLPQSARTLLLLPSGEMHRNDIQFSHCHEYHTDSSIRFELPDASPRAPVPQRHMVDLPAGLTVPIELETGIDSASAHVGDLLRGHVINDIRHKGKTIIPKGAIATGRIRGLERLRSPRPGIDLTIELAELEWENSMAEFYGELLQSGSGRGGENTLLNLPMGNGEVSALPISAGDSKSTAKAPQIPGTGVLHMKGSEFHIAAGLRLNWRTWEPNERLRKSKP
jgi:hypothetical protein